MPSMRCQKRVDNHELRLAAIPAKEELHELELAMTRLQAR